MYITVICDPEKELLTDSRILKLLKQYKMEDQADDFREVKEENITASVVLMRHTIT